MSDISWVDQNEKRFYPTIATIGKKYRDCIINQNYNAEVGIVQDFMDEITRLIRMGQNETLESRRIDSDLTSNEDYNNLAPFRTQDVAYVLARVDGENDGPDYYWLCAMKDHTYAYVTGGCDYTGWDCQSSGSAEILPTLKLALDKFPEKDEPYAGNRLIKKSIYEQLIGDRAFGEVITA